MTFSRWVLLSLLVACGSQHVNRSPARPPITEPPQPAASPVAIAFVLEGWEMWIGNDQAANLPDAERYAGVLRPFQEAFASVPVTGFPAGSQAAVIAYTDRAQVRRPMGPIEKLDGAAFGTQQDYSGVIDRSLVDGVELGLTELAKVAGARHILVVLGDGSDTTDQTAKARLGALAQRAAAAHVEVLSIVYKGALSPPESPIRALDPHMLEVSSVDAIATHLRWSFARWKQKPVVPGGSGGEPVVLALLVSGAETWMGNDDIVEEDDPSRYWGVLKSLSAALEKAPMTGFPAGSQATVVTYASGTQVRMPLLPIENLGGQSLGSQRDYRGGYGDDLVSGVRLTFTELAKVEHARRVVIVIGDGADTNNQAAKLQLQELAEQAAELHIEVHAIVYKGPLSDVTTVVTALDPKALILTSTDAVVSELGWRLDRLRKR